MKTNLLTVWMGCMLALLIGGCSSSQVPAEEEGVPPTVEPVAETDAAPRDVTEAPVAAAEPNQPASVDEMPALDPAPAPAQVESHLAEHRDAGSSSYTVRSGDTLMKIAFESYGDLYQWKKVYQDNKDTIADPNALIVGTVLKVDSSGSSVGLSRNGEKYRIKKGDTLGTISKEIYGTPKKWRKLWENNKELIHEPNRIYAGFYLYYTLSPEDQKPSTMGKVEPKAEPARAPASAAPKAKSAK